MTSICEHGYGKKAVEVSPLVLERTPDGMRQYSQGNWERILDAISRMSHVGNSGFNVLMQIDKSDVDYNIELIDRIKCKLPPFKKTSKYQWATALRIVLEGTEGRSLDTVHLACALIEMGYGVRFQDSQYFLTNYPCAQVLKHYDIIWRPDCGFC